MKRFYILISIFILLTVSPIYAVSTILQVNKKLSSGEYIRDEKYYKMNDILMQIDSNNVKFREDDDNYIFIIEQKLKHDNMKMKYTYKNINPAIMLASFPEPIIIEGLSGYELYTDHSNYTYEAKALKNSNMIARNYYKDRITFDNTTTEEVQFCNEPFFMADLYGYSLITKKNKDKSPHKVSYTKTFTYDMKPAMVGEVYYNYHEFEMNIKYEIKIDKNDFMNYRYMTTYIPEIFKQERWDIIENETFKFYNMCTRSMDLLPYVEEHTHDFKIRDSYKDYHELYCEGCEWVKKINHEYIDTYDGITENLCECGRHRYVNIYIENNLDDIKYDGVLEPGDDFPIYEINKIGNHLSKIEERTKEFSKDNLEDSSENEISIKKYEYENELILPEKVGNYSSSYNLYYDINKYSIIFNKTNNLNITIDDSLYMNNMVYEVNETKKLIKNKYVAEGYDFLGWCDDENLLYDDTIDDFSKVKYVDEEELLNLTYENEKNINLYPIFKIIKFSITYRNSVNANTILKTNCDVNTNEKFPNAVELGVGHRGYLFVGYYIKGNNVNNTTTGLIKYIKSDGKGNGGNIDVMAKFTSKSSDDDSSVGPDIGGSSGGDNTNNSEDKNINETNESMNNDSEVNNGNTENTGNESVENKDNNSEKDDNNEEKESTGEYNEDNEEDDDEKNKGKKLIDDNDSDDSSGGIDTDMNNNAEAKDSILTELKNIIKSIIAVIKGYISDIINAIKAFFNDVIKYMLPYIDRILAFLSKLKHRIYGFLSYAYGILLEILNNLSASFMLTIIIIAGIGISLYYLFLLILYIIEKRREKLHENINSN